MKKYFSIIATLIFITSHAQVYVNSYDNSHITAEGIFGSNKKIIETNISIIDLSKQVNRVLSGGLHKFAEPKNVDISPILEASKDIKGTEIVFRQQVIAQNATSITITFDKLNLSKNAQLYLYNSEGTIITGPITSIENIGINKLNKIWSSNSFVGNSVIIELKIPSKELNENELHINKILFGLPQSSDKTNSDSVSIGNFNASSSCNINVICSQGNAMVNERKAICLISTADGGSASGALINNSCNLLVPYLLTAWHVTNGRDPNSWTFLFGWWSEGGH